MGKDKGGGLAMKLSWTKEQEQVIQLRERNILVAAAAGSGKTAVLVERIITMITDESRQVDIDRLLIVTFTNAAAAEMRERIGAAIEKKIEEQPDNIHLQKQQTLIHTAMITTIHSFCLDVIRNHFNEIDLDPSFRIGDEGELKLLKADVLNKVLESYYEEGKEEFFDFVESYSTGKSDSEIEEMVLKLFDFSMSHPEPEKWLLNCLDVYDIQASNELNDSNFMKFLMNYIRRIIEDCKKYIEMSIEIANESSGPYMYLDALNSDLLLFRGLEKCNSYEDYRNYLLNPNFARLSSKKDASVEDDKRNQVKDLRNLVKDYLKKMKEQFYYQDLDEMLSDIKHTRASTQMLIELTLEFAKCYSLKKRERNLVDFNDLEHFALEILTDFDDAGMRKPSLVADELSENFKEIMIDEYQDSNLVQEEILTSVSSTRYNRPNLFMVGDVKQSIYKFRMARPEIFMEKYNTYTTADSSNQRIDLHKNFRSRENVLASINDIFYKIMSKDLGNIDYNVESALNTGAVFEEDNVAEEVRKSELILIDQTISDEEGNYQSSSSDKDFTSIELEAKVVAKRIKELTSEETGLMVWDKTKQTYRLAQYKDIVILLRTISGWADTFVTLLMEEGIPAFSQSQTGYFTAIEVQTVLNLLKVIDNPSQEIPLAGILRSPMVGISTKDLAHIKIEFPKLPLYDAVKKYAEMGKELNLKESIQVFLTELEEFRDMVPYTAIHDLIVHVLEKTDYRLYTAAMPAGGKRRANLDVLVEKAIAFEGTSYRGLFHFIRYIEKLQKYDVDFGEVSLIGGNDNTVRIMSIHKSKGLEFPIVFASGLGKKFNQQDVNSKLVIHPDYGIGADFVDYENRIKSPTLIKKALQQSLRLENLGEELRVLYVDLTRAKEKLIMTGTVAKLEDKRKKWEANKTATDKLAYSVLSTADNFLDWIVPAISVDTCEIKEINPMEVIEMEKLGQEVTYLKKDTLLNWDKDMVYDQDIKEEIEKRFSFVYGFKKEGSMQTKLSVSEIKKLSMGMDEESNYLFQEPEAILPKFLYGEQEETGADRGTAYHTVLEALDFSVNFTVEKIENVIETLVQKGKLSKESAKVLHVNKLYQFSNSSLRKRMAVAFENGSLHKEQQFVFGVKATEFDEDYDSDELILIQGVIDVFFEEEDGLVLVDYKTDYAEEGQEEVLLSRYRAQFKYYKKALEQITGRNVKEMILYSFSLSKEIKVNDIG